MTKFIITVAMVTISFLSKAQVSETRNVSSFSKIQATDGLEVIYSKSNTTSIAVESKNSPALSNVQTKIKNNTLFIYRVKKGAQVKIFVNAPEVAEVVLKSNSKFRIIDELTAPAVTIKVSSGSYFFGHINSKSLVLRATSNSNLIVTTNSVSVSGNFSDDAKTRISGKATNVNLSLDTNAYCNTFNLASDTISIIASNKAHAIICGLANLDLNIEEEATVTYYGTPTKLQMVSGLTLTEKESSSLNAEAKVYN